MEPFGPNELAAQIATLILVVNNLWSERKLKRLSQIFSQLSDPEESPEVMEKRWESWAKSENRRAEIEEQSEEVVYRDGN